MTKETIGWKIEFFATVRGKSPVVEFIDGLQARERAKVRYHLKLLRDFGIDLREPHAKPLKGHNSTMAHYGGAFALCVAL